MEKGHVVVITERSFFTLVTVLIIVLFLYLFIDIRIE